MTAKAERGALRELARQYGVQETYHDVHSKIQRAAEDTLVAVLRALGARIEHVSEAPDALREARDKRWRTMLEPIAVVWEDEPARFAIRLPAAHASERAHLELTLEGGESSEWDVDLAKLHPNETTGVESDVYVVKELDLPDDLPIGYHTLCITAAGGSEQCLVMVAPVRVYQPGRGTRDWGVFVPLHALRSERNWGIGDFTDLRELASWLRGLGCSIVGTLPFLASARGEASPYAPLSRLFWNEGFVDVMALTGREVAPGEIDALRSADLVDYERIATLKRCELDRQAKAAYERDVEWRRVEAFAGALPQARDYARFRAVWERQHVPWQQWPERMRSGHLDVGDYDHEVERYHLYAQWAADVQVRGLIDDMGPDQQLYVDLPVGVHPEGYDTWKEQDAYVSGVSLGAPPDKFFATGQNWGFPPLNPERIRRQGYDYVIAYLRRQMECAGMLRIDHVMGLHRLFWIPNGAGPTEGVYVRQHSDELYAILAIESHRTRTPVVGENLGTVPAYVNRSMRRHGVHRMRVMQFELTDNEGNLPRLGREDVASLNTHDMAPFAGYWTDKDVNDLSRLGFLADADAAKERRQRKHMRRTIARRLGKGPARAGDADGREALTELLGSLARSKAGTLVISLEDLWLEDRPQNVPGTLDEFPNWRRKLRYSLNEMKTMPEVRETLVKVDRLRRDVS